MNFLSLMIEIISSGEAGASYSYRSTREDVKYYHNIHSSKFKEVVELHMKYGQYRDHNETSKPE